MNATQIPVILFLWEPADFLKDARRYFDMGTFVFSFFAVVYAWLRSNNCNWTCLDTKRA